MESSGDQTIEYHELSTADVLVVQVMPSGLVIILLPMPELAVATKIDNSGAHVTKSHELSAADV
jgi:hypothetical protein